jgi:hypothetical protein
MGANASLDHRFTGCSDHMEHRNGLRYVSPSSNNHKIRMLCYSPSTNSSTFFPRNRIYANETDSITLPHLPRTLKVFSVHGIHRWAALGPLRTAPHRCPRRLLHLPLWTPKTVHTGRFNYLCGCHAATGLHKGRRQLVPGQRFQSGVWRFASVLSGEKRWH